MAGVRPRAARRRSTRSPAFDLTALAVVAVLLFGSFAAGGSFLYQHLYSPSAFVLNYLNLLSAGKAADALALPGVAVDSSALTDAGLAPNASEALLRQAALGTLSDITTVKEVADGDTTLVTVAYHAGPHEGSSTFRVARSGTIGLAPVWRFATSPLAVINLTVRGALQFEVNGFAVDKRQVSVQGDDADPLAPVPLLVFSPGLYSITVDTPTAASPGVAVLSDSPATGIPVNVQADPTPELVAVVQERVDEFLTGCATQRVLQPTGCPFGFFVQNRIVEPPVWSMTTFPTVSLAPDGANWKIPATEATAHIRVDIMSIYDGSINQVDEDVPFTVEGTVKILPDGTASIQLSGSTS